MTNNGAGTGPQPGQIWRHYKGGIYRVVLLAREERTGLPGVVYESMRDGLTWFRPLEDFLAIVRDAHGTQPRFIRYEPQESA